MVTKIEAVDMEMDLLTTDALKNGMADACRKREHLGCPFPPISD